MEKIQKRRDFLKSIGLVAGLSQLPLMGWAEGFATMFQEGVKPLGEFSLLKIGKLLSGYHFPFVEKFSTDSFKSEFKLYNLYGENATFAGELALTSVADGATRNFNFSSWRLANNGVMNKDQIYKYIVTGNAICKNNPTFSPQRWNVSSKIALSNESIAYKDTGLYYSGIEANTQIVNDHQGKLIRKPIGPIPLSWKWGLIAVVQNMSKESLQELQFSLLDEFDAIYKNQKIRYRKTVTLDCGKGQTLDFKVFELTGDGILPTVYWVDNLNRTVFVISGMEAFILKSETDV